MGEKAHQASRGRRARYLVHEGESCRGKQCQTGIMVFMAHHVVTVLALSLSPLLPPHPPHPSIPSCSPALNGAADELGIEFMGKSTFFSIDSRPSAPSFMWLTSAKTPHIHNPAQQGHSPWKINAGQSPWKHRGGELGVFCLHEEQYCYRGVM